MDVCTWYVFMNAKHTLHGNVCRDYVELAHLQCQIVWAWLEKQYGAS